MEASNGHKIPLVQYALCSCAPRSQVLLGTTVGSTNISTIVFFLLLALLVYVLVATTNELLWASLKESVVRQLDLKLLATVLGNSKLISSEEVRTLRATHFPMFGNVVCFPLWTYAGQGRGRVLCIVRGFEVRVVFGIVDGEGGLTNRIHSGNGCPFGPVEIDRPVPVQPSHLLVSI